MYSYRRRKSVNYWSGRGQHLIYDELRADVAGMVQERCPGLSHVISMRSDLPGLFGKRGRKLFDSD